MNDIKYLQAYIYGIKCKTNNGLYIGSSYQTLNRRLTKHKTDMRGYMGELKSYRNYRSSLDVLINDNYDIFIIEEYPCKTKKQLLTREAQYIIKYRKEGIDVVNKRMPIIMDYSLSSDLDLVSLPCPSLT